MKTSIAGPQALRSPASSTPNRFRPKRLSNITNLSLDATGRGLFRLHEAQSDKENDFGLVNKEVLLLKKLLHEKERLLVLQNEQMQAMQTNLVQTMRRSSALNNEIIQYNCRLQKVRLEAILEVGEVWDLRLHDLQELLHERSLRASSLKAFIHGGSADDSRKEVTKHPWKRLSQSRS
jgi:hypothetical protein